MKWYYSLFLVFLACSGKKSVPVQDDNDFCSKIHRNDSVSLSGELEDISELMETKTGVYVLEDGGGSLVTRAWLSEYAEQTIDVQYFIFSADNVGLIACDYLVRAADRGVKVRILLDDLMVDGGLKEIQTLDSHPNIEIKIYNPGINLGKNIFQKVKKFATEFSSANKRMHNKTFIVDNKVVITGGRNVAGEYYDYDHEYNFRDRDVLLLGKTVAKVDASFQEFWTSKFSVNVSLFGEVDQNEKLDSTRFDNLHTYACNPENFWPQIRTQIENMVPVFNQIKNSDELVWVDDVDFVSDKPGKNDVKGMKGGGASTTALVNLIKGATKTLEIQTPYLVTTELSRNLFKEAVGRGVKVRILTNSLASTDNLEAFSGYQGDRAKLLKTGVEIYEFRPDAKERVDIMTGKLSDTLETAPIFGLHAKTMVIDDSITVIGTFNLDPRSANLNTECVTIIPSKKVSEKVLHGIEIEFKPENSWRTTLESNPDNKVGYLKRAKTWTRKVIPKSIL